MAQMPELPTRLPLIVVPANRDDTAAKDAKLVNCYVEKEAGEYWIYKRFGTLSQANPPGVAASGRGCVNWNGYIYAIFAGSLYRIADDLSGAWAQVGGTLDQTNGIYRFSSCLGTTRKLQLGNGVKAYNYDDANGLVEIAVDGTVHTAGAFIVDAQYTILVAGTTDFTLVGAANSTPGTVFTATGVGSGSGTATIANFPSGGFVKGWAYINGTSYVMQQSAHIRGSDINNPAVWNPLNDIMAQIEPDLGVALAKQLVYAVALKQWSTEIFFDAGNAVGSPLGSVQGGKVNFGCVSADSVQDVEGTLVWVATTRAVSIQVVAFTNLKPEVISTAPIERLLQNADFSVTYAWQARFNGHRFYVLTLTQSNLTLAYDLDEKMWWQLTDVNGNYFPYIAATYTSDHQHLLQHESTGEMYLASTNYFTDDGETITCDVITPNFDGGVRRRKSLARLELIGDQIPGSEVKVRVNDADYDATKWTNFRVLDQSKQRPFITDCGTFYRRVHHFRHQSPTRMRIQAVELQMTLGTL